VIRIPPQQRTADILDFALLLSMCALPFAALAIAVAVIWR